MVAKIIRLTVPMAVALLVGCQTISPVEPVADTQRSNEPVEAQLPTAGSDATGGSTAEEVETEGSAPAESSLAADEPVAAQSDPEPVPEDVVTRLQQQALQLQSEGRWAEAELILERALRIDAEKVDLYHQLATVRMGQQRFGEAEQIALKGLSLTDQTPAFKASLWEVVAQCRSAQGDVAGADDARSEMVRWLSAD